ncbi:MAG: TcpQ domain-containing protein [Desulfovibrio sp.]|jgi:hypothetical protein|nr:TcpQ domain-containing protein [Desulfovibrio sp.]
MKKFLILLCIMCSGCVSRSVNGAYDGVSGEYPTTAVRLAAQAAEELSRRYPPGRTSVSLNAAPGAFGGAFEEKLRQRGFAVRPGGQFADVGVSYTLDTIQNEPSCYLRVATSDGQSFGFAKELAPERDVPVTMPPVAARAESTVESRPLPESPDPAAPLSDKSASLPKPLLADAAVKPRTSVPPSAPAVSSSTAAASFGKHPESGNLASSKAFKPATTTAAFVPSQSSAQPLSSPTAPAQPSVPLSYVYKPLDAVNVASPSVYADVRWEISPGSLRGQINGWTARAGYTLVWHTDRDFEMSSYTAYRGDFVEAVKQLFSGLQRAGYPLRITIYKGNQTLEITEN